MLLIGIVYLDYLYRELVGIPFIGQGGSNQVIFGQLFMAKSYKPIISAVHV